MPPPKEEVNSCPKCVELSEKLEESETIRKNLMAQLIVSQDALYRACSCQHPFKDKCIACKTRIFLPFYATQFKKLLLAVKKFEAELEKNLEESGVATANVVDLVSIIKLLEI